MSYRFECGLCSSVASAQLQFYPKKTQDRLIGLPVIVRLKWSEQSLMFLNQMRGLRQKEKEGGTFLPSPLPTNTLYILSIICLLFSNLLLYSFPVFLRRAPEGDIIKRKSRTSPESVSTCTRTGKATIPSHFLTHNNFSAKGKHFNHVRFSFVDNIVMCTF